MAEASQGPELPEARARKRVVRGGMIAGFVAVAMVGAAYAAVPLYQAFCKATGFGGVTQRAEKASSVVLDRTVRVSFDTNVRNDLPWTFKAEQNSVDVKIGATGMAFFKVTNTSNRAITGRATYNVVPQTAGYYFRKLECFCFSDQTLQPGEVAEFPMIFFVDPQFAKDDETKNATDITLSYTFYPALDDAAAAKPVKTSAPRAVSGLGGKASPGL